MEQYLKQIAQTESLREVLQAYFIETLKEMAGADAIEGRTTDGYHDAKKAINKSFAKIVEAYGEKKAKNKVNHAV